MFFSGCAFSILSYSLVHLRRTLFYMNFLNAPIVDDDTDTDGCFLLWNSATRQLKLANPLNIPSYERGVARVLGYDLPP